MPTPVSAARLCLANDSAIALDSAVSTAHRRSHSQTTSLHIIFSLLSSSSSPLLRDALTRARTASFSSRLQFKALDLCFSVALDRLPSSSLPDGDDPPVSNSLMAAIKRSQANQRRHPDTFHLYQQQQNQAFTGVRVELQQLVLAILDDPIVSRVFGEAGFRSCDVKMGILRKEAAQVVRYGRCPPLFLCNFAGGEGYGYMGGEENWRRIGEVIGEGRNPMMVGVGAGEWEELPEEIGGVKVVSLEGEIRRGDKEGIKGRIEEEKGVVFSVGDLRGLVEGGREDGGGVVDYLVEEISRELEERKGGFWVMGWSKTYESYLKFLSRYPMVDKDWKLQLVPITSGRIGMGGLQTKATRLVCFFL